MGPTMSELFGCFSMNSAPSYDQKGERMGNQGRPHRLAVMIPSTNTVVETDFSRFGAVDVSCHFGRVRIHEESLGDDEHFLSFLEQLRAEMGHALDSVLTCRPDTVVMGMSAETFWGGREGNLEFEAGLRAHTDLPVVSGADACAEALRTLGCKSVAVLTPYQELGDDEVVRYLTDVGFEVEKLVGLRCEGATAIAEVPTARIASKFLELADHPCDAVIQVGTNLRGAEVAPWIEEQVGKPIIAINAAIYWRALRRAGLRTQLQGWGALLRDH